MNFRAEPICAENGCLREVKQRERCNQNNGESSRRLRRRRKTRANANWQTGETKLVTCWAVDPLKVAPLSPHSTKRNLSKIPCFDPI